ncbi:MAG: hypothetical protein JWP28_857 [Phenylobacterium sp.]|jgi:hypothetical protein|uniref:ester cyclase n=1 Tax=Phenylobacterium sp. TaxID=1871053 RepID=UPI0026151B98|nr:ester cyclase [Phenylobacterium sp.]MDB5464336.1 hypothetical protein [Phenylobacterium sp.]MDB5496826.1 hypothetical protein [Phenylobacterium sp.]
MSLQDDNKAIVGRWFTDFWGETCDLSVVDAITAPDMLMKYSLHAPRRSHDDVKAFMTDFRAAFPDLKFWEAVRPWASAMRQELQLGLSRKPTFAAPVLRQ